MGNLWRRIGMAVLVAGVCVGCGAFKNLQSAKGSFTSAREAGAETRAPYEFYSAETYLQLAEHEFDELDLKQTTIYAEKSRDFSGQALEKAGGGAQ